MQVDLTDEEREALARFLRAGIDTDKFPLSPRLKPIKAILAKFDPPQPMLELKPAEQLTPPSRGTPAKRR